MVIRDERYRVRLVFPFLCTPTASVAMSIPIGFREFSEDDYRKFIRTRLRILCGDVVTPTASTFDRQLKIADKNIDADIRNESCCAIACAIFGELLRQTRTQSSCAAPGGATGIGIIAFQSSSAPYWPGEAAKSEDAQRLSTFWADINRAVLSDLQDECAAISASQKHSNSSSGRSPKTET